MLEEDSIKVVATDISVINCRFQFSEACAAVWFLNVSGYIRVHKSQFLSNHANVPFCTTNGALYLLLAKEMMLFLETSMLQL